MPAIPIACTVTLLEKMLLLSPAGFTLILAPLPVFATFNQGALRLISQVNAPHAGSTRKSAAGGGVPSLAARNVSSVGDTKSRIGVVAPSTIPEKRTPSV